MIVDIPVDHTMDTVTVAYYDVLSAHLVNNEPLARCVIKAAKKLNVHPDYIYTIAIAEGGTSGEYSKNADGTHDMGVMQINYERWWSEIKRIGYKVDWRKALHQPCTNVQLGGIIFRYRAKPAKGAYEAMANYHWYSSVENKKPHIRYRERLIPIYKAIVADRERFAKTGKYNPSLRCRYAHCD